MANNIRVTKQQELESIIQQLSSSSPGSNEEMDTIITRLKNIYQGDYRHDYSIFFPLLYDLANDNSQSSIATLLFSLDMLRDYIERDNLNEEDGSYAEPYRQIIKLIDHLNLESVRLEIELKNETQLHDTQIKLEQTSQKLLEASEKLDKANKKLDKANKKAKSLQSEFISMLSIFSAVVLLFAVDSSYISSAISSISEASIFKVVLIVDICGLVIINGVFLLFSFIIYIINKNSDISEEQQKFGALGRKTIIFNILFLCIIIVDIVFWVLALQGVSPFVSLL